MVWGRWRERAALVAGLCLATPGFARPVPDYDGRPDETSALEVLSWAPRVALYPLYLVTEYLVRWPLATGISAAERHYIPARTWRLFTFGTEGEAGVVPTALYSFGLRPSAGLYFWGQGDEGRKFTLHLATGGDEWWLAKARLRLRGVAEDRDFATSELSFTALFDERPDYRFNGLGAASSAENGSRFWWRQLGGRVDAEWSFGALDGVGAHVELRDNSFAGSSHDDDGPLDVVFPDLVRQAPGFDGYLLGEVGVRVALDTRAAQRPASGTGVGLQAEAALAGDLNNADRRFARYGGRAELAVDVFGMGRTLSLRQTAHGTVALGDEATPFAEMPSLGGVALHRGFRAGRLRGATATVTSVDYTYPIWLLLDGLLFVEAGNTFGEDFDGWSMGAHRLSFGVGARTATKRDVSFDVLFGAGTSRFDDDRFEVEAVHFLVGVNRGL